MARKEVFTPNEVRGLAGFKPRKATAPQCPYCGELMKWGSSFLLWQRDHLDSRSHRWWWRTKKIFTLGRCVEKASHR